MTYIIAEAGVNHNGDINMAKELVSEAARAGANCVKFQTFKASGLVTKKAIQADYQIRNSGVEESQFDMLKRLELTHEWHFELKSECSKFGIDFLSTAFDDESLDFLNRDIGLEFFKIPSGEITNAPFLLRHALTKKKIILSTGMADLGDIESALSVIAFGYINSDGSTPSRAAFRAAYASRDGQKALKDKVTVLHCTTDYPTKLTDVNLLSMDTIREAFGLSVGYSDHTLGISVPLAAAARGAEVIEKHFTLDRTLPGPDHKASLEPNEFEAMVKGIRDIDISLGQRLKFPVDAELANMPIARKSLVAKIPIKAGEPFSFENLTSKRPGSGISPLSFWDVLGKEADRNYDVDDLIVGGFE